MLPLLAFLLVPGVVGCGGDTVSGSPTTSAVAKEDLFDPCTGVPDEALLAAGVDPATEVPGILGRPMESGWKICGWDNSQYFLVVFSTSHTVAEFESKPGNVEFEDVTMAGRQGRRFKVEGASKDLLCDVVFPTRHGVIQLRISNKPITGEREDPCVVLDRVGDFIVPVFPE
ncbi:DUF3558 domain-containing protein [Nocardia sp. 004]|uniref:DUF3558 domain-containing protein n=1 Tax=Nocardia sp. 004 TaxID=3385978 RepID=UPI0039A3E90E